MLHVSVGDVEFRGHTDSGFLIGPGGFVGWEGAPATRRESAERPFAHGSFDAPAFKSGRLVRLSGAALGSSEHEVTALERVLSGLGAGTSRVVVTTAAGALWADGSVEGEIRFDRVGGANEAFFALSLWFPDPFKFGDTLTSVSSGANVSTSHRGNTDAWQRFEVTGNLPNGYWLTGRGKTFEVPGPLVPGQLDVVDFRSRTVLRDGVPVLGISPRVWSVPGFDEPVTWALTPFVSGTGTATSFITDTYV